LLVRRGDDPDADRLVAEGFDAMETLTPMSQWDPGARLPPRSHI